jgi:hypothetical protein
LLAFVNFLPDLEPDSKPGTTGRSLRGGWQRLRALLGRVEALFGGPARIARGVLQAAATAFAPRPSYTLGRLENSFPRGTERSMETWNAWSRG